MQVKAIVSGHPLRATVLAAAGLALAGMLPIGNLNAAPTTPPASFAIASPQAGTTVTSPVELKITVQGAEIGRPVTGEDHLHVSVDGGPEQAVYKNHVFSLKLAPGKHTISVDLAGPTHEPLLPAKFVTFTVH